MGWIAISAAVLIGIASAVYDINRCHSAGGEIERVGAFHECLATR